MDRDASAALREQFESTAIYELLGLRFEHLGEHEVTLTLDVGSVHVNIDGVLHGGVIALVADTAMGAAARLAALPETANRTLSVTVTFQAAVPAGETVRCTARVTNRSRRFVWASCDLRRIRDGRLLAEATSLHYSTTPNGKRPDPC